MIDVLVDDGLRRVVSLPCRRFTERPFIRLRRAHLRIDVADRTSVTMRPRPGTRSICVGRAEHGQPILPVIPQRPVFRERVERREQHIDVGLAVIAPQALLQRLDREVHRISTAARPNQSSRRNLRPDEPVRIG